LSWGLGFVGLGAAAAGIGGWMYPISTVLGAFWSIEVWGMPRDVFEGHGRTTSFKKHIKYVLGSCADPYRMDIRNHLVHNLKHQSFFTRRCAVEIDHVWRLLMGNQGHCQDGSGNFKPPDVNAEEVLCGAN
jgi:hypothetical protein